MQDKERLVVFFASTGFVGALSATVFLWFFIGLETPLVLGFDRLWIYCTFPFVGALLAAFWSAFFQPDSFGVGEGVVVAGLSFLSFCALLSTLGAGLVGFLAFVMFGFIFVGWVLLLFGAAAGYWFRHAGRRSAL